VLCDIAKSHRDPRQRWSMLGFQHELLFMKLKRRRGSVVFEARQTD
jgi:hypothetical protein